MFSCKDGDETGGSNFREQRKKIRSVGNLPDFSDRHSLWVSRACLLRLGTMIKQRSGEVERG